jgi:hypothetical protein
MKSSRDMLGLTSGDVVGVAMMQRTGRSSKASDEYGCELVEAEQLDIQTFQLLGDPREQCLLIIVDSRARQVHLPATAS